MSEEIRISVISASPRPYGMVRFIAKLVVELLKRENVEVYYFDVYDYRIEPCIGCVSDSVKLCRIPCIIDDDMKVLYDYVDRSDGLIFVTPIYWYNIPGPLKNFIDRLTVFENMIFIEGRSRIEGKVAGFIAIGNDTGAIALLQNLMIVLNSMGIAIPPWAIAYHHAKDDVIYNESFLLDVANVARCTLLMIKALKGIEKPKYWYLATKEFKDYVVTLAKQLYDEMMSKL